MKLESYSVKGAKPIEAFSVEGLFETVVLAGPNGVGKTTLMVQLLNLFQNPGGLPSIIAKVRATNQEEVAAWGQHTLQTSIPAEAAKLRAFLQRQQKRGQLRSSVLNFDSARQLEQVQPYNFNWESADPLQENIGWNTVYQPLRGRFQDTIHSLYRKVRSQKEEISKRALLLKESGEKSMPLDFQYPLEKFEDAFTKLLPGKTLEKLNERSQTVSFKTNGTVLPLTSLSSGEREVVSIVFDFLLRDPKDCIIIFDEPELHLHPELSYRLLRTLRDIGERNQFILSTHSPDIITASLDQSVVFVAPPNTGRPNQAVQLREDDEASKVLHLIGQSIGVISLGKKIVLIEGISSSLDKQTYGSIVGSEHPEFVLVPTGGKESIHSFVKAFETVLNKTVWGVDFFMLCDGDCMTSTSGDKTGGRLKILPRYHVENYFLNENVIARVFEQLDEPKGSWLCDPVKIRAELLTIAKDFLSYAVALHVAHRLRNATGNADLMPQECHCVDVAKLESLFDVQRDSEVKRISSTLDTNIVRELVRTDFARLSNFIIYDSDEWQKQIPGKPILKKFASKTPIDVATLKRLYIKAAPTVTPDIFQEIREIFKQFGKL
ncbi:MAG: ATP-binding protein [Bdellovibrio sp.]|nr:ATP-binding protein [Bdellovibrio sp.]